MFALSACGGVKKDNLTAPRSPDVIARGAHLVKGLAACGFCHGVTSSPVAPIAGGRDVYDLYGAVSSPNISPSKSGIGFMSDDEVILSIRGIWKKHPDKRSPTIHRGYEWISSADALSIVSYLRSLTPINNKVKERVVGFTSRNSTGLFSAPAKVTGFVADINPSDKILYGKYLVNHVARCGSCHTMDSSIFSGEKYLAGGKVFKNESVEMVVPGLVGTSKSMNMWSESELIEYFKAGIRPDKTTIDPKACPVEFYRNANEQEISAMVLYLRSLS